MRRQKPQLLGSAENPQLSKVVYSKPGVGQNIALDASHTARNSTNSIFFLSWFIQLHFLIHKVLCCFYCEEDLHTWFDDLHFSLIQSLRLAEHYKCHNI